MSFEDFAVKNQNPKYHLGHLFLDICKLKPPEDIFQIDAATGEKESYSSVHSRSVQLARCFRNFGLRPGDVLALGGLNHLDLHIPYYAALLNGLPIVAVDPYFLYDEIKYLFKLTEPKIAFCQNETKEIYERAARDIGIDVKIVTFGGGDSGLNKFIEKFDDHSEDEHQPEDFDLDKVYAWLVTTSGTTGLPKVAAFKHKVIIGTMVGHLKVSIKNQYDRGIHGLNLSPVQWISGYYNAVGMPLLGLCKLQTSNPDSIDHIIDIINQYKPVYCMLSPSTVSRILKSGKPCDLTCVDRCVVAGAKIHKEIFLALKERLRPEAQLSEAYGQTESIGPILTPNPKGPPGSCGIPMPAFIRQIKLVDPETGNEVTEPHVPGEMWTKGPRFSEYYKNLEETVAAFSEDGWYKTGDLLYRDEQKNYFYVDRLKQLIKCRNYHIYPTELEEVVTRLPGVLEVCVVGVPHAEDGQVPAACVVKRNGFELTEKDINDTVHSKLSAIKQLRGGIIFMDSLPKTSSGKIARKALQVHVLKTLDLE